jgi:multimeric flavodoxin WrbA
MVKCDVIIFVTPVYWYSMSSYMKTFFDRLTDLIQILKDLGRNPAGKECCLVSSGTDKKFPLGFEIPFKNTCNYLGMNFVKSFYFYVQKDGIMSEDTKNDAKKFGQQIFK